MWVEEKSARSSKIHPIFTLCCQSGAVSLPQFLPTPDFLQSLLDNPRFKDHIRTYNSMLSFTSMGGKIDNSVLDGQGPYAFRINGANYHKIGSLLPSPGNKPKFAQLYVHDTENEIQNRIEAVNFKSSPAKIEASVLHGLQCMLDDINPYVKVFRNARDMLTESHIPNLSIRLLESRDGRQYTRPTTNEIAALIIGDGTEDVENRDIIVCTTDGYLKRINERHPSYMPLQYPLLFPYGEDGWRKKIAFTADSIRSRKEVSIREYYAFRLQFRNTEGNTLLHGGRLFQQFVVDTYAAIEQDRLNWVRMNQNVHVIEFQKRGLPHAHILLTLTKDDKLNSPDEINDIISAELPDQHTDPLAYETVVKCMIHGPCGVVNPRSPCMVDGKCSKRYPRKFVKETRIDENGFVIYRRRDDGKSLNINGFDVDNRWVIPYNRDLITKYNAHVNIERCAQTKVIKYLFKYIHKGVDRATVVIEDNSIPHNNNEKQQYKQVDEVKQYLDCRYVSAIESCWRIFDFELQQQYPPVEHLQYHLPNEQFVIFRDSDRIESVMARPGIKDTMLTQWFEVNIAHEDARSLTYAEFPTKWVWNKDGREWTRRKNKFSIGRLYYAHPNSGERYYLRMLLNIVRGSTSYEDIRTINGNVYPSFKAACSALGLLEDDNEWHESLIEASTWATGKQLRNMFCSMLIFSEIKNPLDIWERHWEDLIDDLQSTTRRETGSRAIKVGKMAFLSKRGVSISFIGTQQKCKACEKTVYVVDQLSADGVAYHKACFKCSHCKGTLKGVLCGKPQFEQLFKKTGATQFFMEKSNPIQPNAFGNKEIRNDDVVGNFDIATTNAQIRKLLCCRNLQAIICMINRSIDASRNSFEEAKDNHI
ncbi:hypothetical protein HHK36_025451 [Tetracentron sinense]|uniref:LIM zinc-binding domain-containing protein n=1 Tax=Tetracentron sinense TaxID=13715 RepID=A0A835D3K5_TETSI|nr:hypothetical protein HHK36_025451 [Tetracentron sinense]